MRVLGPRPERSGCFVVLAFYLVSYLCLLSIARPWGRSREPCRPLLPALSPRDRRAPCCGLPHPRRTQRPVPPGTATATARMAVWPGDVGAGPSRPHFGASREQRRPMRVGFSEAPCPGAKARKGVLPSRAERGGVGERCFHPSPGLDFRVGEWVPQRRCEREGDLLLSARGLGWALCGVCKLVIALAPARPATW